MISDLKKKITLESEESKMWTQSLCSPTPVSA